MQKAANLLRLGTKVLAICGFFLTFAQVAWAIDSGFAGPVCLVSVAPYCCVLWLLHYTRSFFWLVLMFTLAFLFATWGNYFYFDMIRLRFSPSNSMYFLLVPIAEIVCLLPVLVTIFVSRLRKRFNRCP